MRMYRFWAVYECMKISDSIEMILIYRMLVNILQSDVMLLMMKTVLERALDLKARCFSESHLQKVSGSLTLF